VDTSQHHIQKSSPPPPLAAVAHGSGAGFGFKALPIARSARPALPRLYCGHHISDGDVHVDHVLPRQIIHHDEIWNLVLAHSICNLNKSDRVVAAHFIEKLLFRNENIVGSSHPWKKQIEYQLGMTALRRREALKNHYEKASEHHLVPRFPV